VSSIDFAIDPPLHKLNKRRTKSSDKIRGNHSSQSKDCITVWYLTTETVRIEESVAQSTEREEEYIIVDLIFELTVDNSSIPIDRRTKEGCRK